MPARNHLEGFPSQGTTRRGQAIIYTYTYAYKHIRTYVRRRSLARHPLDPIEVQYGAVSRTRCLPNHAESLGGTDHIVSRRALLSLEHVSLPVWRRIRWRNLRLLRECLPSGKDKSLAITSSSHPLCPGNPMAVPQCDGACARCWCSCSPSANSAQLWPPTRRFQVYLPGLFQLCKNSPDANRFQLRVSREPIH